MCHVDHCESKLLHNELDVGQSVSGERNTDRFSADKGFVEAPLVRDQIFGLHGNIGLTAISLLLSPQLGSNHGAVSQLVADLDVHGSLGSGVDLNGNALALGISSLTIQLAVVELNNAEVGIVSADSISRSGEGLVGSTGNLGSASDLAGLGVQSDGSVSFRPRVRTWAYIL